MNARAPQEARPLPSAFFERPTALVARELLGSTLVSCIGGDRTSGVIVETEAYLGADDPGSHAATKGITARNSVMYGPPGHAYVYFTYGNHHMLNLVTEVEGVAGAVLIRAIEPLEGIETMRDRRGDREDVDLTNGPGKVAQALGVSLQHNGVALGGELSVERAPRMPDGAVAAGGRVGLSSGHELPLRFFIVGNRYVSNGRTGPKPRRSAAAAGKGSA